MAKNYYTYVTDDDLTYSFLQDTAIATAIGNGAAVDLHPRVAGARHFFRPRKTGVKLSSGRYVYYINGNKDFAGLSQGDVISIGTVVGKVGEKHYSQAKAV